MKKAIFLLLLIVALHIHIKLKQMTRLETVQMIENRIRTEYEKYKHTPVDFALSAAMKIYSSLECDILPNEEADPFTVFDNSFKKD
jgi:hypothetical protein